MTRISGRVKKIWERAVLLVIAAVFLCSCGVNASVNSVDSEPYTTDRDSALYTSVPDTTETVTAEPVTSETIEPVTSDSEPETSFVEESTSEPETEDMSPFPKLTEPINVDTEQLYTDYNRKSGGRSALYDYTDDKLLFQTGGYYTKIYPASVTKLFTVTYARTILRLDHILTIGKEINLVSSGSSRAGIKIGERYRFGEILYSLLLPSGNDVAYAIAAECGKVISN
ncbi:MAG: hypothetical protein J5830_04945, partial [Clostridia bacterium]|nr:hypothetical protein [Clostridia bacterium]